MFGKKKSEVVGPQDMVMRPREEWDIRKPKGSQGIGAMLPEGMLASAPDFGAPEGESKAARDARRNAELLESRDIAKPEGSQGIGAMLPEGMLKSAPDFGAPVESKAARSDRRKAALLKGGDIDAPYKSAGIGVLLPGGTPFEQPDFGAPEGETAEAGSARRSAFLRNGKDIAALPKPYPYMGESCIGDLLPNGAPERKRGFLARLKQKKVDLSETIAHTAGM